jgi:VWFA-related protein
MIGRIGCLSLFAAAAIAARPQSTSFRSNVDVVAVNTLVTAGGKPVSGLLKADFEVLDEGKRQTVLDVTFETLPVDVTIVADISGSVQGALLTSLHRAIDRVQLGLRPADRVHLVGFNEAIGEVTPAMRTGTALSALLPEPAGGTSLFDAVVVSSVRPVDETYRQMVLVFTDGIDTTSILDADTVDAVAHRLSATFFVIALEASRQPESSPAMNGSHRWLLESITDVTGGQLLSLAAGSDLQPAFVRALDTFRASYVIRYAPSDISRPGWHAITVRLLRPGRFDVRARRGYTVGP